MTSASCVRHASLWNFHLHPRGFPLHQAMAGEAPLPYAQRRKDRRSGICALSAELSMERTHPLGDGNCHRFASRRQACTDGSLHRHSGYGTAGTAGCVCGIDSQSVRCNGDPSCHSLRRSAHCGRGRGRCRQCVGTTGTDEARSFVNTERYYIFHAIYCIFMFLCYNIVNLNYT